MAKKSYLLAFSKDRLTSPCREIAGGTFHLDRPARALIRNYRKLASQVSLDFYQQLFGKRIKRADLSAVAETPQ